MCKLNIIIILCQMLVYSIWIYIYILVYSCYLYIVYIYIYIYLQFYIYIYIYVHIIYNIYVYIYIYTFKINHQIPQPVIHFRGCFAILPPENSKKKKGYQIGHLKLASQLILNWFRSSWGTRQALQGT